MLSTEATVVSIQVGLPSTYGAPCPAASPHASGLAEEASTWTTAFFKQPVQGPVHFLADRLAGDGVADTRHHGGRDKAVLAYAADHYTAWQHEWQEPTLVTGAFGENLTIAGQTEASVCLGDTWALGQVWLQISQPRQPCWKLARRWNRPDLPKRVLQTGRTGWYLRIVRPGIAAPGRITLMERPYPDWPISRCVQVAFAKSPAGPQQAGAQEISAPQAERHALAQLPLLADAWREWLQQSSQSQAN